MVSVLIWWIIENSLISFICAIQCHHLFWKLECISFIPQIGHFSRKWPSNLLHKRHNIVSVESSNLLTTANWLKISAHLDAFFDGGHKKKIPLPFQIQIEWSIFFFIERIILFILWMHSKKYSKCIQMRMENCYYVCIIKSNAMCNEVSLCRRSHIISVYPERS